MHPMTRERITYAVVTALLTFAVLWFGLTLAIKAVGGGP